MRTKSVQWFILMAAAFLLTCAVRQPVLADDNTATTMRLVHYEGSVEVEGAEGGPKAVMESMRFADGDTLSTGLDSLASVSLDTGRILTVAPSSRVSFSQQAKKLKLTLTDGELFLDVKEKLSEEESLDIQTSTMAIGIRGTIVFVRDRRNASTAAGRNTTVGFLEGTGRVTFTNANGETQSMDVPPGEQVVLRDEDGNGQTDAVPETTTMTAADIAGFVNDQVQKDGSTKERVLQASDVLENTADKFAADGDWTWDRKVTLIAQSASKLYDGSPLTRPTDVLVYGLPGDFTIQARAGGSQTDAGEGSNPISSYVIYNRNGEDVTGHFTSIETVAGKLQVDPAPLTIWTESAQKVYDGTPLTAPETQVRTVPGYEAGDPLWRDTAYVGAAARGYETLYGVCGTTWVHGTNPLTGEIREIELPAGKKMTVYLSDEDGKQSIEFRIDDMAEGEIPEEVLRLYADNPDLLAQACEDAGWDEEIIRRLISLLPDEEKKEETVEQSDLTVARSAAEKLMQDSTNVRIHIDTENTSYNNRALGNKEAHFTGIHIDSSIRITATGSQTDAGQSTNTYTIDWGTANKNNYIVAEDLGTLTVTQAPLTVKTGSAQKAYDGEPLTNAEATLDGLVNGETATITATGTITEAGSAANTYTIEWGSARSSNYAITEQLGTLTVTPEGAPSYDDPVTLTASSSEKTYDGTPLTASFTVSGLPDGFAVQAAATGSQTGAGSSASTIPSYTILDADGNDVTAQFTNVTAVNGTLTVTPAPLTITTSTEAKIYDGTPLTGTVTVTGLVNGETVTAAASSLTDVGTADNTYTIEWGTTNKDNYTITEEIGTLTVMAQDAPVTLTAASAEKTYDGTALTSSSVTAEGLLDGFTYTAAATGSQTDAGSSANTVSSYTILDSSGRDVTSQFSNITTQSGTLTVSPAPLTITTSTDEKVYDGTPLTGTVTVTGLADGDTVTATATSLTDTGTKDNAYTIDWGTTNKDNYTITEETGTLTVTKATLTITTSTDEKVYDGTPLAGIVTVTGLADGENVTTTVASLTDAGTKDDIYTIDWGTTNPDNYTITEDLGTLKVTPLPVVFEMEWDEAGTSREYNGGPVLAEDMSGTYPDGSEVELEKAIGIMDADGFELYTKYEYTFNLTGGGQVTMLLNSCVDAGSYTVVPETTFLAGKEGNYEITYTNNNIVITPLPITFDLQLADSREYNGTVQTPETIVGDYGWGDWYLTYPDPWLVSEDGTFYGEFRLLRRAYQYEQEGTNYERIKLEGSGYKDVVDDYTITPTYTFLAGKESNYEISFTHNKLTIKPAPLTIKASKEKVYDGKPLNGLDAITVNDHALETDGTIILETGETITFNAPTSITDVSTAENAYTINWGDVNTDNYTVTENPGTLTVTKAPLKIKTGSKEKVYDRTALSNAGLEATITGLVNGETATATIIENSITDAGSAKNYYNLTWGTAKEGNYEITKDLGELKVSPLEIQLEPIVSQPPDRTDYEVTSLQVYIGSDADYSVSRSDVGWDISILGDVIQTKIRVRFTDAYSGYDGTGVWVDLTYEFDSYNNYDISCMTVRFYRIDDTTPASFGMSGRSVANIEDEDNTRAIVNAKSEKSVESSKNTAVLDQKDDEQRNVEEKSDPTEEKETTVDEWDDKTASKAETTKNDDIEVSGTDTVSEDTAAEKEEVGSEKKTDTEDTTAEKEEVDPKKKTDTKDTAEKKEDTDLEKKTDTEDIAGKKEDTDSDKKTDAESNVTENNKDDQAKDKESAGKPDSKNTDSEENKKEIEPTDEFAGGDEAAESTGTIGDAITDAGSQAASAVVNAVESAAAAAVNNDPSPETDAGQTEGDT